MPYICTAHNLKEKKYHRKTMPSQSATGQKFVWVDKENGRFHVESSVADIFTRETPLMMWWLVNSNAREKMPYNRQLEETLADMPEAYHAVVRIKLEPFNPTKADRLLQHIVLQRRTLSNITFGIVDKPSVVSAVMPKSKQRSSLEITDWVQYMAMPDGNTFYLLHKPELLSLQAS